MSFKSTAYVVDEDEGVFVQNVEGVQLKSKAGKDILEGYLTTKGVDKEGDIFTENALKKIADRIMDDVNTVEVVFPEADLEDFEAVASDSTTGNIDHNNFPGFPFADKRIVPAFKIVNAEYDGYGVAIKAVLNTDGMLPDTADAVKNAVQEGFLTAFSIEFKIPRGATEVVQGEEGQTIRKIDDAQPVGAALTGRPANPRAVITDADFKSMMKGLEAKKTVSGVTFEGTKTGSLDEGEIPSDGFESHYLFPGDTKSESSYPVVDADMFLRRGNVESAYQLGARGGVSEEELHNKLRRLNEEFENPPIDFEEDGKSDIDTTMSNEEEDAQEEVKQEETPEQEQGQEEEVAEEEQPQEEGASLEEEVKALRDTVEEVKQSNEELRAENEELREELEDFETVEEIKSDLGELREELEDLSPQDEPVADTEEERFEESRETKSRLERVLDFVGGEGTREREQYVNKNLEQLADKFNMSEEEVKNYV